MKRRNNRLVTIALILIFIAAAIGLGYYLNIERTKVVAQRKTLVNLEQEAADMDSLIRQYREVETKVTDIGKTLPSTTVDIASFLQDVNSSASISGATVEQVVNDLQPELKTKDGHLVKVILTITGSYINTTRLINRISNLPYYFQVDSMTVKPNRIGSLETKMNILLITTYNET